MHWYLDVLKKYAVFEGRARRTEYWVFALFNFLIGLLLSVIENALGITWLTDIYFLAVLVPNLAVLVRRLHDTNKSGWWALLLLLPVVGGIVLFIFALIDSDPGENQYGPNPKYLES